MGTLSLLWPILFRYPGFALTCYAVADDVRELFRLLNETKSKSISKYNA